MGKLSPKVTEGVENELCLTPFGCFAATFPKIGESDEPRKVVDFSDKAKNKICYGKFSIKPEGGNLRFNYSHQTPPMLPRLRFRKLVRPKNRFERIGASQQSLGQERWPHPKFPPFWLKYGRNELQA